MDIRPYGEDDAPGIAALLDLCWPDDPVLRVLHDQHGAIDEEPWRRTLVAEEDGAVVVAG